VVVPIVLVVHLFLDVPIFVVFADQHIALIAVVNDHLIQPFMRRFYYR